jgi:hypothetical protein
LQQHQDDLQQLEAEQSDLRENIRVRRDRQFFLETCPLPL